MTTETLVQQIPTQKIFSDEKNFNCRGTDIIAYNVHDLAENIENNGLIQPIILRPYHEKNFDYQVIVGHRRLKAYNLLKLEERLIKGKESPEFIPAIVREDLEQDELSCTILNFVENLARENLDIQQEAMTVLKLKGMGISREDICEKLKVSSGWLQVREALATMPVEVQQLAAQGFLTQPNIKTLYRKPKEEQLKLAYYIRDQKLKNDKKAVKIPTKTKIKNPVKKKPQDHMVIREMRDYLYDSLGPSFTTRTLAWILGDVSTLEYLVDVSEQCLLSDKEFVKPEWVNYDA